MTVTVQAEEATLGYDVLRKHRALASTEHVPDVTANIAAAAPHACL